MKINCIAVDDEPLALEKMETFIGKVPFLNLMQLCNNAIDAISFLNENKVDLLFLDIQMDDLTGIQLLESIKVKPKVILTTAYDSYAIKGYELDVTDYLLKPISFDRFLKAVNKVYQDFSSTPFSVPNKDYETDEFVFIKTENRMQKVVFNDILYIEGMKDYLRVVTPDAKIMTLQSFAKIEEVLPSQNFIRIHKSYIVSINKIDSIERNRVKIGSVEIPIGDIYKKQFFDLLKSKGLM